MKRIGIDPDNKFIGCAILENNELTINKYKIPEFIYEIIPSWEIEYSDLCANHKYGEMKIYLEGGWLNPYYYHSTENSMIINNIARKIGMNHQVGIMIDEILTYKRIKYETVKPVQYSKYKPQKEKINHNQLMKMINDYGIKFTAERSNQDERDSALLLLFYEYELKKPVEEYTFF